MAYSDYGGYAYRNGERVEDRSDYTITPDGGGFGTPGAYPGFAAIASGASQEQVKQFVSWPHYHVVLGDGPIYLGLYKQSTFAVHRGADEVGKDELGITDGWKEWKDEKGEVHRWIDSDFFIESGTPLRFEIDGHKAEIRFENSDNYYIYARLEQPDGTIWTGFSGYGVGAGLEDAGYGFSTEEQEGRLFEIFSKART